MTGKKVFISYPSESVIEVQKIVDKLEKDGIEVWFDKANRFVGEMISDVILAAIQEAVCCVYILNEHSATSAWCHAEVGVFWGNGKRIIVHPIEPKAPVPEFLAGRRFANTYKEMLESIKDIMNQSVSEKDHPLIRSAVLNTFKITSDDDKRDKRQAEIIRTEGNQKNPKFRLAASSGKSYLKSGEIVWKKLGLGELITQDDNPAAFDVVLESPFSDFALTRAAANRLDKHHWKDKIDPESLIERLQFPNINIRVTDVPVNCSLFFTSQSVLYDPYLWALPDKNGRTENNFWVFEFGKVSHRDPEFVKQFDCYCVLEKHFEFLWHYSVPLPAIFHRPEGNSPFPIGEAFIDFLENDPTANQAFYDFYKSNPKLALNRYDEFTEQFPKELQTRFAKKLRSQTRVQDFIEWTQQLKEKFDALSTRKWTIESYMTELMAETGSLADSIMIQEQYRKRRPQQKPIDLADSIADIAFILHNIADHYHIDFEKAYLDMLKITENKLNQRKQNKSNH